MINHIRQRGSIHVYVQHEVDTPNVVDDTMLLPSNRENDLGGESNVGPDFIGSSDARAEDGESTKSGGASYTDSSLSSEGALGTESEDEENKRASYKFVGENFLSKIRLIPKLKLTEMQKLAKEELKVELSRDLIIGDGSRFTFMTDKYKSIPPLARVPLAAPAPPAAAALAPPAPSQTVAFKASASSPLAPSTQPTPPIMPTFSTQQIHTRLRSKGKQAVQEIGLYTDERIGMQILNPSMRGETMVTTPTKCTNKRKDKETTDGT
ncbi:hypothetical protein GOBAR_AA12854 [Gossypium barbadense]|uniref:Uncharacterized protein n=1 Tax=Gossypium barbadense TaxID=3634 RepID=A0A2P5XWP6_GOSBA|nr:hypothetical protein GOBAR_AA12854 [Gossypium barbadense]